MKVAILGGGVAGLSAAHELAERGFDVHVYERNAELGGKARSFGKPGSAPEGQRPLPGEHGFRFFPGFYWHVVDTMGRIPTAAGAVADNLAFTTKAAFGQEGRPLVDFSTASHAGSADAFLRDLEQQFTLPQLGLTHADAVFFASRLFRFAVSCESRRNDELENLSWWNFLDADNRSPAFRKVLVEGMTRSLVAMKSRQASTRTIGRILLQMIFTFTLKGIGMDRVLNAPTSDAWIEPWRRYLEGTGRCTFHLQSEVQSFAFSGGRIAGVSVRGPDGAASLVSADHYIAALPVEVMAAVAARTPALLQASPSLQRIGALCVDWMNGIQFYLKDDIPFIPGHVIALDSPWALTCISQAQFWQGFDWSRCGDGQVNGVLSVDISDWQAPGKFVHQRPAGECTAADEVAQECWAQLLPHFAATPTPLPAQPHAWFLDPAISFEPALRGVQPVSAWIQALGKLKAAALPTSNLEPLLINTCRSLANRPDADNEVPNLFLASDYVRTSTDLACMEGANEAARLAVNALLRAANSTAQRCQVRPLREPRFLDPWKAADEFHYRNGLAPFLAPAGSLK